MASLLQGDQVLQIYDVICPPLNTAKGGLAEKSSFNDPELSKDSMVSFSHFSLDFLIFFEKTEAD